MSMPLVALCADEESLRNPEMLGLGGENLAAQSWLQLFSSAEQGTMPLRNDTWHSRGGVACVMRRFPSTRCGCSRRRFIGGCMLSAQESGSLRSRASAAGIDASFTRQAFVERYALCKRSPCRPRRRCSRRLAGRRLRAGRCKRGCTCLCACEGAQPAFAQPAYGGAQPQAQQQALAPAQGNSRGFLLPVVRAGGAGKAPLPCLPHMRRSGWGKHAAARLICSLVMAELAGVQHFAAHRRGHWNPRKADEAAAAGQQRPRCWRLRCTSMRQRRWLRRRRRFLKRCVGGSTSLWRTPGRVEQHSGAARAQLEGAVPHDQRMSSVYACKRAR